jgi:hypothetical protein
MQWFNTRWMIEGKNERCEPRGGPIMNPTMTSPSAPNLVSCLMADRMAEAAELRRATEVSDLDRGTPHLFRRFLGMDVRRGVRRAQPAPLPQGH